METSEIRKTIQAGRSLYKKGEIKLAKEKLNIALTALETSTAINAREWRDLTEATSEITALQLIWASYQLEREKTRKFHASLKATPPTNPFAIDLQKAFG